MIYILVFTLSLLNFHFAQLFKKNKFLFYFFSCLGIVVPCILASVRDLSIGTDTDTYVKRIFEQALIDKDLFNFLQHSNSAVKDVLYLFTSFLCARVSDNISTLFFVNELLVIVPIYISLVKSNKENGSAVVFGMFLFFMFFYNQSFNLARQSIALAFGVLAIQYLNEKKSLKFFALSIIASLYHSTAVVMILIYFLYILQARRKLFKVKIKHINKIILVGLGLLILFFPYFILLLIKTGIFSGKLANFIENYNLGLDINWANTIFYLFIAIIININKLKNKIPNFRFYKFSSVVCLLILQLGARIKFSERIGYYLFYPLIFLTLPKLIINENGKMDKTSLINLVLLSFVFLVYWFFWIILQEYHETYPFVFYGG